MSRTKNSIMNMTASLLGTIAYDVGYFFLRALFVRVLSKEYLGVAGLFTSILTMLSLMELGVGTAFSVALYQPVAKNDTETIKSMMHFYRKVYRIVGAAVMVVGLILTPFLQYIVKEMPENIPHIRLIFLLYVADTAISYFCIYKQSLFIANQKSYKVTLWYNAARLLMLLAQGMVLIITKNFILYLLVQILFTRGANMYISHRADGEYPYLKDKTALSLAPEKKKEVGTLAYAASIAKVGSILVSGTDQIIISRAIGLVAGGLYSNYTMIFSSLISIERKVFAAITASVGNLHVETSPEKMREVFRRTAFFGFWLSTFTTVCFFCLAQDFIFVWLGPDFLLSPSFLLCFALELYLYTVRLSSQTFNEATGAYKYWKYRAIIEGVINLVVSIALVKPLGLTGVVLGTIVSCMTTQLWIEPYALYHCVFHKSTKEYWGKFASNFVLTMALCGGTNLICGVVPYAGLAGLALKSLVCLVVPNLILVMIYWRNEHFEFYLNLLRKVLGKKYV